MGVDGKGVVILCYVDFMVILNVGKISDLFLLFEINGLCDVIVMDNFVEFG